MLKDNGVIIHVRNGARDLLIQNWFYKKSKGRQWKGRRPRNFYFFSWSSMPIILIIFCLALPADCSIFNTENQVFIGQLVCWSCITPDFSHVWKSTRWRLLKMYTAFHSKFEGPASSLEFLFGTFCYCYWAVPSVIDRVHFNDCLPSTIHLHGYCDF